MWEHILRIIKPGRAIVIFGTEPFSSALRMSNIKNYKYDWIWLKTKPTGYQISKIKPLSKHENITVFGKGKILYNPQMIVRDKPRIGNVHSTNNQMKVSGGGVYREYKNYTHRYPTSVIEFGNAIQKRKLHPTQKPVDLMEYLIKTYTNEGDVVLDFTCGSGTTGVACRDTNRDFILIEKELKYCKIAKERTGAKIVKFKKKSSNG